MTLKAYQKVYNELKERIQNHEYDIGSYLPTEPELEKMFSVSRTTIRKAVSLLADEGFLHVRQGRGTEVISSFPADQYYKFHNVVGIREIFSTASTQMVVHFKYLDRIPAPEHIAKALEVPPQTEIYQLQRLMYVDNKPFSLMRNYLRTDVVPDLERYFEELFDLYSLLKEKYGIEFYKGKEHISAVSAGFVESQLLEVEPNTPLLFCTRYAKTKTCPLEFVQTYLKTDRYDLVVEMDGWPAHGSPMRSVNEQ